MPDARLVQNGDVGESDEAHIDRGRELEQFRNQELAERAQSEERKRISRELHDRVAHDMAVAHQSLQLYDAFKEQDPERAAQKMEVAKEAIERAMRSTRDLSQALQETEIVDGLDSPLLGVLREVLPPGVKSNLNVEGDWKHLTPRTRDQIYLILREAIRNAASYSGASRVMVEVRVDAEEAWAIVKDDGTGFDPEVALRMGGSGLRFMEERAEMVGGRCRVYSGSGTTGTRVEVRVPLESE
jgi:signal transduction histidine kinase